MSIEELAEELQKVYGRRLAELEIENEDLKRENEELARDIELYRKSRDSVSDKIMKFFAMPWIKRIFNQDVLYK